MYISRSAICIYFRFAFNYREQMPQQEPMDIKSGSPIHLLDIHVSRGTRLMDIPKILTQSCAILTPGIPCPVWVTQNLLKTKKLILDTSWKTAECYTKQSQLFLCWDKRLGITDSGLRTGPRHSQRITATSTDLTQSSFVWAVASWWWLVQGCEGI